LGQWALSQTVFSRFLSRIFSVVTEPQGIFFLSHSGSFFLIDVSDIMIDYSDLKTLLKLSMIVSFMVFI